MTAITMMMTIPAVSASSSRLMRITSSSRSCVMNYNYKTCKDHYSMAILRTNHSLMMTRRRTFPQRQRRQPQQQRHVQLRKQSASLPSPETATALGVHQASSSNYGRLSIDKIDHILNTPREIPIPRWISPQRHTFTLSECFGHASFFLVAASYAVDDFLQLRLIAIAGSSAMLVFTYFHPHGRVLWLPFKWNIMFIALNSWRVAMVYIDQYRSEQLSDELLRVYEQHFYVLEKTDFARLVRLGKIEQFKKGQVLVTQGQENRYVRLVLKGDLAVDRDGQITYFLDEGNFISEVGLHAGILLRGSVEACGTVTADSDHVMVLTWDRTELMRLLELHKSIERSLKAVMSWDIVSKLKSQRTLLASGRIKDPELWTRKRREQTSHRYRSILSNILKHPQYLNKRKDELANYRVIHHIDLSEHIQALQEMGWTLKEFEEGKKEGQVDDDKLERTSQGLFWWIQSWWNAL